MSHLMAALLAEVDRLGAKVTWIALDAGGWKCVVSGVELPPHDGRGESGVGALDEVLRLAGRVGVR